MGKKTMKTIGSLLLALVMIFSLHAPALAAEDTLDLEKTGSISVTPRDTDGDHAVIKGSTFTLYQVAAAGIQNSNLTYTLTEEFSGSKADLSNLNASGLADSLSSYAKTVKLTGTVQKAAADGTVTFENLLPALYLLVQTGTPKNASPVEPFLVNLPMTGKDGSWVYDVDASPKAEVTTEKDYIDVSVTKEWNDNNSASRPDSVEVSLYRDSERIDTVTLSDDNSWTYTWDNLKKSDRYSVKEKSVKNYTATYSKDGNDFTVTNTKNAAKLAQTGQLNWPVPVLAGCGVVLFAIGWALVNLKKKKA